MSLSSSIRSGVLFLAVNLFILTGTAPCSAEDKGDIPVIENGREGDIVELFKPYELSGPLADGWILGDVIVNWGSIDVEFEKPDSDEVVIFTMEHPSRAAAEARKTQNFALVPGKGCDREDAARSLEMIFTAIETNDQGRFWKVTSKEPGEGTAGIAGMGRLLGRSRDSMMGQVVMFLGDGVVRTVFVVILLLFFGFRRQSTTENWIRWSLLGVVVLGFGLRWLISQKTAMGAWPYSRTPDFTYRLFYGPVLSWFSTLSGGRIFLTDIASLTTFIMAVLGPLAAFVHGRYLLGDDRKALFAALAMALLPNHIRFARSEVLFMPSIVMSALSFALTHVAMREPNKVVRWAAMIILLWVNSVMLVLRPLNVLFLPLLAWVIVFMRPDQVTLKRRLLVGLVTIGFGTWVAYDNLSSGYSDQVSDGLSLNVLRDAVFVMVDPHNNTLLNPRISPLLFTILAFLGGFRLWAARGEDRRRSIFLVIWLVLFIGCHAYIMPPEVAMVARYHLHLAIPFVLLIGAGIPWLWSRSRRWSIGLGVLALAVPLLHLGYEQDIDFTDMHEYDFVMRERSRIPEDCTVLEYLGAPSEEVNSRFIRAGAVLEDGEHKSLFNVMAIGADASVLDPANDGSDPLRPMVRELFKAPPQCLYYFEGVPCWGDKRLDQRIAPACEALRHEVPLTTVAETSFNHRPYDHNISDGIPDDGQPVTIRLYRVDLK